jgi:hypothetical protein
LTQEKSIDATVMEKSPEKPITHWEEIVKKIIFLIIIYN